MENETLMRQVHLLSIQVGLPQVFTSEELIGTDQANWTSAFFKQPVVGPVWVGRTNVAGDGQGSRAGDHQAGAASQSAAEPGIEIRVALTSFARDLHSHPFEASRSTTPSNCQSGFETSPVALRTWPFLEECASSEKRWTPRCYISVRDSAAPTRRVSEARLADASG